MGPRGASFRVFTLLAIALALAVPSTVPAQEAQQTSIAGVTFEVDVVDANGTAVRTVEPGANGTLVVTLTPQNVNGTANLTVAAATTGDAFSLPGSTSETVTFTNASTNQTTVLFPWIATSEDAAAGGFRVTVTADDTGESRDVTIPVAIIPPEPEPEPPETPPAEPDGYGLPVVLATGLASLVVGGLGGYAFGKRRRPKPQPRSATLQRIELEKQAESARSDEERAAVQQQIKAREKEQSLNRDIQILAAKRQDVERMLDLIKKRRESGQITQLQYQKMMEKKQAEMDKINADIAELENKKP